MQKKKINKLTVNGKEIINQKEIIQEETMYYNQLISAKIKIHQNITYSQKIFKN